MATYLSPTESLLVGVPALVLGVALLFFGYRIFRVLIAILGGLVGFQLGTQLPGPTLLMGALGALVGVILVLAFYRVGVFLVGATVGFLLVDALTAGAQPAAGSWAWAIPIGAALAGGLLALWLERPAIIVATAFDGAFLTMTAGFMLADASAPRPLVWLAGLVALALLGATAQWRLAAPREG